MSGSFFTLNQKYNALLAIINGFFPFPPGPTPYPPPTDVMTLTTAQTASGLKTFSTLPQSSVIPTNANDLVNKTYADSLVPTPVNAVTIDGSQTLGTGIKTFTNLPVCSAIPNSGSQLVNKTYVDGAIPATPNLSQVLVAGNSANATSINMNTNAISNISTATAKTSLVVNNAVTGQNATMGTGNLTINNSVGGSTTSPLLTLNQTNLSSVSLYTEKYNQRTYTSVSPCIQDSYFSKNGTGTKTEQVRVSVNTPLANNSQYTIAVNSGGVLTNYMTCNGYYGTNDFNFPINMTTHSILGVTTITDSQSLPFLPQGNITANSNVSTPITAYSNNHQLLLRASPVPFIDTFVVQPQSVGTCSILCSATGGGYQWLGTSCGEVWVYDSGINNWTLLTQLSGAVYALYFFSGVLYIGGAFTNCSFPGASGVDFNNICYITSPTTTAVTPSPFVWLGATNAGFNGAVNAITGDGGNNIYFGGVFTQDTDGTVSCLYFANYYIPGNNLYSLNSVGGDGFDGAVNNLDFLGGTICATGAFSNIISLGVSTYSPFCITFSIAGGYVVSTIYQFDGALGNLAYQIPGYDLIKNNGTNFLVGAGNNSYAGADFFFQVSPTCIPSPAFGTNLNSQIYSFIYTSGIVYAVSSGGYYSDGALTATIPFSSYLFLASWNGTQYFNNQGVGAQWAFNGSVSNSFALQSGRTIKYVGGTFSGGVVCPVPQDGYNLLLNWNGTNYIVVGTPQSVGAWSYF